MKEIDRLYMERPTSGSRTIKSMLEARGRKIARSRVVRLMCLRAIYPKRRTSSPGDGHRIYPYLLRGMKVKRPRQVYAADITYIPMAKGFLYLVAVIDWHSRKALAHRLSNTMDAAFCVEAMEEAIVRYGAPQVFNTDQGAQFTSEAFTGALKEHGVRISMDGKGRCSTTCTWSASGAASSRKKSTGAPTRRWPRPGRGLPITCATSTKSGLTRDLTTEHPTTYSTNESRCPKRHNPTRQYT